MAELLPLYRTEFGWEQRQSFRHPDRYEEDVEEVVFDSPFLDLRAILGKSHTTLFSFLVLGDQNAGKSTFLHLLCCSGRVCEYAGETGANDTTTIRSDNKNEDRPKLTGFEFLQLGSFLPILSSSFINSRWLFNESDVEQHRDEFPYLDTDVARGLVLINADDFRFFCSEFSLPIVHSDSSSVNSNSILVPSDSPFVGLQFIEMGGDHLDRLVDFEQLKDKQQTSEITNNANRTVNSTSCDCLTPSEDLERSKFESFVNGVLTRSVELLNESSNILYFINAKTLFLNPSDLANQSGLLMCEKGLRRLMKRLFLLASHRTSTSPLRLHVFVSRLPNISVDPNVTEQDISEWSVGIANSVLRIVAEFKLWNCGQTEENKKSQINDLQVKIESAIRGGGSQTNNGISRTPFLEEWGEDVLREKEAEMKKAENNISFRIIKAILTCILSGASNGTPTQILNHVQLVSLNITRNYEFEENTNQMDSTLIESKEKTRKLKLSVHGVISTVVQIFKSQAMRIETEQQPISSSVVGELGVIMVAIFLRLASWKWTSSMSYCSALDVWLTSTSLGDLFDFVQDRVFEPSIERVPPFYTHDEIQDFIHQLCIPPTTLINLWPSLCSGLLTTYLVLPHCADLYLVPPSDQQPINLSAGSTEDQEKQSGDVSAIRLPYSRQLMMYVIRVLEEQLNRGVALPIDVWDSVTSNARHQRKFETFCQEISNFNQTIPTDHHCVTDDPLVNCFEEIISMIHSGFRGELIGSEPSGQEMRVRRLINLSTDLYQVIHIASVHSPELLEGSGFTVQVNSEWISSITFSRTHGGVGSTVSRYSVQIFISPEASPKELSYYLQG